MEVIPLTLALSLLLSLTFIALFVREFSRPRRAGAEHDSLLPLEHDLTPRHADIAGGRRGEPAPDLSVGSHAHEHDHAAHGHEARRSEKCSEGKPGAPCCSSCSRRRERLERRAAAALAASLSPASENTQPRA